MKLILISLLIFILLVAVSMIYRESYVKRKVRKLESHQYNIVRPLIQKLDSRQTISKLEVLALVKDPALRFVIYRILQVYKRSDLFPSEYFNREKGAEGFLVTWLEFPTELGNAPEKIEFVTLVTIQENEPLDYYVFRYKTKKQLSIGQHSWMLGVSGPYRYDSQPYDVPIRVFSRFNAEDKVTPKEEAIWVHKNIHRT